MPWSLLPVLLRHRERGSRELSRRENVSRLFSAKTPAGKNSPALIHICPKRSDKPFDDRLAHNGDAVCRVSLQVVSCRLCCLITMSLLLFRCSCGQLVTQHTSVPSGPKEEGVPLVQLEVQPAERWSPLRHTHTSPTDSYGVIEFQGGGHINKAMVLQQLQIPC